MDSTTTTADKQGPSAEPHVVIIGAGFGGLNAVRALADAPVRVTVVDRQNHHLFQPLLYQVATAVLSAADIAQPIRAILRRQRNVTVLLAEATAIDPAARTLTLRDGQLTYDYLILAAGVRHAYFGHDEWEMDAPGLKTLDDALAIRRRILLAFERAERETDPARKAALLTFVIVGGGPTGVEMAGAIAEVARHALARDFDNVDPATASVILIEAGPRILPTFPESLSRRAEASLNRLGVQVRTGHAVTGVNPGSVQIGEERIAAGTVHWAAGVRAESLPATLGVPLDRAGRVQVDPDLTVPGHPELFVIGDLAALARPNGKPLPGVAQVAIQQGRWAAANLARQLAGEPMTPFRYNNKGDLATIGRNAAVANIRGLKLWGFPAWIVWAVVHIFYLIGFRNRVLVSLQWLWGYLTFQRGARLITGAPAPPATPSDQP